jgi:four helix bundle protein
VGEQESVSEKRRAEVNRHTDLEVYRRSFDAAMRISELTKSFPSEERFALTDQIRRSSRSVCANLAEAWRKRRYEAAFASKITDSEAEAAETQTWLEFAIECCHTSRETGGDLWLEYDRILGMLVSMRRRAKDWIL